MIKAYFWLNAVIYLAFALWCTLKRVSTSAVAGYLQLNNSGWSEYLVIYGGLQIGLALFFVYLALDPLLYKAGLIFAVLLYVPVVLYRVITIYYFRPVENVTLVIGGMEILLMLGAVILLSRLLANTVNGTAIS